MASPLQMPGPDSGSYEVGFDPIGEDMAGLAPSGQFPVGVRLPGDPSAEHGWLTGEDLAGLASDDLARIPQGMDMGADGEDGLSDADGDIASSAGFHMIHTFEEMYGPQPGMQEEHGSLPGMAMRDLPVGTLPNQGYPGISVAYPHGIDSMRGLDLAGGPAPLGEQNTNSSGPVGDRFEPVQQALDGGER